MGLFGGSTKTTTNEKFDTGPSSFQAPYLTEAFTGAQSAYNNSKGTPYFQGDTYAGMSEEAKKALAAMRDFAGGTGMNTANTLSSIGSGLAGYAGQAGGMIDKFLGMADEDSVKANTEAAALYANNPHLTGQIDAVSRDVRRNLSEDLLPNIDRNASAGGNINSSRAGIASGIAQRGAADRVADISAQLRGDAWNRGLTLAQQDRAQKMDAYSTAADAYQGLGSLGMNAMSQGAEAGYGAFDRINSANTLDQADRQGSLDADFEKWQGEDERVWDILNRYNSIVGGSQWGQSGTSSGTSKSKQSGGILGSILGAGSSIAGIATAISDSRLKKGVRKLGELIDGLGIYAWSYVWQPSSTVNVGVMADEVAEIRPWALGEPIGPFKTVNYAKL